MSAILRFQDQTLYSKFRVLTAYKRPVSKTKNNKQKNPNTNKEVITTEELRYFKPFQCLRLYSIFMHNCMFLSFGTSEFMISPWIMRQRKNWHTHIRGNGWIHALKVVYFFPFRTLESQVVKQKFKKMTEFKMRNIIPECYCKTYQVLIDGNHY